MYFVFENKNLYLYFLIIKNLFNLLKYLIILEYISVSYYLFKVTMFHGTFTL